MPALQVDEKIEGELREYSRAVQAHGLLKDLNGLASKLKGIIASQELAFARERGIIVKTVEELVRDGQEYMTRLIRADMRFNLYLTPENKVLGYDCKWCGGIVKGAPIIDAGVRRDSYNCRICGALVGEKLNE